MKTTRQPTRKAIEFTCRAPEARQVYLAGTFNDWSTTATPLKKTSDGEWQVALQLLPARYEFKFLVDGAWCCELSCDGPHQGCPKCVANPFGTMNRFIDAG